MGKVTAYLFIQLILKNAFSTYFFKYQKNLGGQKVRKPDDKFIFLSKIVQWCSTAFFRRVKLGKIRKNVT